MGDIRNDLIVVRGGGDLATGVIHKLWMAHRKVIILETKQPAAIRRLVAFSEAIYDGEATVEGATAVRVEASCTWGELEKLWENRQIPIMVDPCGDAIERWKPAVVVDAIIAKKNLGTKRDMAELTIALGPGFEAGVDVDVVIETMRGSSLGEVITTGYAIANTGIPGKIMGVDKDRVIHAEVSGILRNVRRIGDVVKQGEVIARIESQEAGDMKVVEVRGTIEGVLKGLIRDGYGVKEGFKIADIDPRLAEVGNCAKISDKARCIGDSVVYVCDL